jgi:chromosome segregation ATPase
MQHERRPSELSSENLRQEIQQCQRSLIRVQAETLAAEGHAQEAEESHHEELAVFCVQLDALDRHLQSEHQQQSEEGTVARTLLLSAREQMAEMKDELREAESEAERIEAQSRLGKPKFHVLNAELERHLRVESALESEVEGLRRAADKLRSELSARQLERERLDERRKYLDEALVSAKDQIHCYEEWSEGVHAELRLAGSELREDQVTDERERRRLEERAAELEYTLREAPREISDAYQDPVVVSDPMLSPSPSVNLLPEEREIDASYAQLRSEGDRFAQGQIAKMCLGTLQPYEATEDGLLPTFSAQPLRTVTPGPAPVGALGIADFGAQAFRAADTRETVI